MWAFAIVELHPVTDGAARMRQVFEAVTMDALLFQGPDQAFQDAVLPCTYGVIISLYILKLLLVLLVHIPGERESPV